MAGKRALRKRLRALDEERGEARRELGAVVLGMYRAHSLDTGALSREAATLAELETEITAIVTEIKGEDPDPAPVLTDGTIGETVEADRLPSTEFIALKADDEEPSGDSGEDEGSAADVRTEAEAEAGGAPVIPAAPITEVQKLPEIDEDPEEDETGEDPDDDESPNEEAPGPLVVPAAPVSTPEPEPDAEPPPPSRLDEIEVQLDDAEKKARKAAKEARLQAEAAASAEISALESDLEAEQERAVEALDALRAKLEESETRADEAEEALRVGASEARTAAAEWLRGQAEAMRREAERQVRDELGPQEDPETDGKVASAEAALAQLTERSKEANARAEEAESALAEAREAHEAELKTRDEELLAEREAKTSALSTAEARLEEIETHAVTAGERVKTAEQELADQKARISADVDERVKARTAAAVEAELAERRKSFEEAEARATAALEEAQAEVERTRTETAEKIEAARAEVLAEVAEKTAAQPGGAEEVAEAGPEAAAKLTAAETRVEELEKSLVEAESSSREAAAEWLRGQVAALRKAARDELAEEIEQARSEGYDAGRADAPSPLPTSGAEPATEVAPLPSAERSTPSRSSGGLTNLNTADFDELRDVGLSITQANRVIGYRERFGGYDKLDDLNQVPGFPAALLAELKTKLEV